MEAVIVRKLKSRRNRLFISKLKKIWLSINVHLSVHAVTEYP